MSSPFKQDAFNALLREMLFADGAQDWGGKGVRYAEDVFFASRGEPEVDLLKAIARGRKGDAVEVVKMAFCTFWADSLLTLRL
jgi:hypothetical protein